VTIKPGAGAKSSAVQGDGAKATNAKTTHAKDGHAKSARAKQAAGGAATKPKPAENAKGESGQ
jgi:hypothetical protein